MKLTNNQLQQIVGGKVTASLVNSIIRGATLLLELGRSLGTALRRIHTNKVCSL